jgi:hypothetical protein
MCKYRKGRADLVQLFKNFLSFFCTTDRGHQEPLGAKISKDPFVLFIEGIGFLFSHKN